MEFVNNSSDSITVKATAQDATSGIAKYEFFIDRERKEDVEERYKNPFDIVYKNDKNAGEFPAVHSNDCTYTFHGLTDTRNHEYFISVRVTDVAGNVSVPVDKTCETYIGNQSSLEVGDYVTYAPDRDNITIEKTNSGHSSDQSFSTPSSSTSSNKWRVLSVGDRKVTLVKGTAGTLTLSGANGYNNMIQILNDICSTCYSKPSIGAVGRSVNIDDFIESTIPSTEQTISGQIYYPRIAESESSVTVNGKNLKHLFQMNEPSSLYIADQQIANTDKLTIKNRSYNNIPYSRPDFLPSLSYWIASRNAVAINNLAYFGGYILNNNKLETTTLYESNNNSRTQCYYVLPVVEVDLSNASFGGTYDYDDEYPADGSEYYPWKIIAIR